MGFEEAHIESGPPTALPWGVRAWALLVTVGCSYEPSRVAGEPGDGAGADAMVVVDAAIDAAVDAPPAVPVTTDHPSVADTFISTVSPDTNFNSQTSALADLDGRVALFQFDLASIPTTATIGKVELHIWSDFDEGQTCNFFQVLEAWSETTATGNSRMTGVAWSTPNAEPPSRGTVSFGTVLPTTPNTEFTVTIDPAIITTWVSNPATNLGFAIVSTSTDGARFSTREQVATQRPFLRITHTP
jgi:hypothetical protein